MSETLEHYGIKGQKWGVRKDREVVLSRTLKNGGRIEVTKDSKAPIAKALSKLSKGFKAYTDSFHDFTITDGSGKKVGQAGFRQVSDTELNLMWVGISSSQRGKGYATAVMDGVVKYAKNNGIEKLTLEVPGKSPDAKHIYTKFGFKETGQVTSAAENPMWGGLTSMELILNEVKHSEFDAKSLLDYIVEGIDNMPSDELEIFHYGIKGQKWGVRRAIKTNGRVGDSEDYTISRAHKKTPNRQLSNAQLKKLNERLQLEKTNKDLTSAGALRKIKAGTSAVAAITAVGTAGATIYNLVKSPAGQAAIAAGKNFLNR